MNKKKLLPIATLLGCLISSGLFAAMNNNGMSNGSGTMKSNQCRQCPDPCPCPPEPCPPKPCEPCCEPNPCCPTTPAYGYDVPCNFGILWGAGPRVCEGTDLFITVDFIWWTAREDGLAYAVDGLNDSTTDDIAKEGSVHHPDWEWTPGFKVGLGYNLWHDDWDIYAQYTWLHFEGDRSSTTSPNLTNDFLSPTWFVLNTSDITKATGRWDLHFNVIDVELGRNYFVSQYLTLRPFVGFKGTWQHQDYKVRYVNGPDSSTDDTVSTRMRQDHDMWGIGIRTGVNFAWMFTRCFSLFSDWALTALMTEYDIDRKDRLETVDSSGNITASVLNVNTQNEFYTLKGVLELDIGLRWEMWFGCNDAYHFMLQAAWEEQLWWNQNNMIQIGNGNFGVGEKAHGDLMLHGLTIKARFDF